MEWLSLLGSFFLSFVVEKGCEIDFTKASLERHGSSSWEKIKFTIPLFSPFCGSLVQELRDRLFEKDSGFTKPVQWSVACLVYIVLLLAR